MEPSDEMVEAALDRWFWNGWRKDHPMAAEWVVNMRSALRAALAVMQEQCRTAWIAGRDAAAEAAEGTFQNNAPHRYVEARDTIVVIIRAMEPPA